MSAPKGGVVGGDVVGGDVVGGDVVGGEVLGGLVDGGVVVELGVSPVLPPSHATSTSVRSDSSAGR